MQVFIVCDLFLKTPIHAPKIGVMRGFHPLNGVQSYRDPQRHFLARKHVIRRYVKIGPLVRAVHEPKSKVASAQQ